MTTPGLWRHGAMAAWHRREFCLAAVAVAAGVGPTTAKADAESDANLRDFDFVVDKVAANYAGWHHKVTDANRAALASLTSRLRTQVASGPSEKLDAVFAEWLAFFKDARLQVLRQDASGMTAAASTRSVDQPRDWTDAAVRQRLGKAGLSRSPVEGIWRINEDRYRVAIARTGDDGDKLIAVVLTTTSDAWRPGQIKALLTRRADGGFDIAYRAGNHAELALTGKLEANDALLTLTGDFGAWVREWPPARDPDEAARLFAIEEMFLRRLTPSTLWLRVPDFNDSRAIAFRSLLADHADLLRATPLLVIDLRNNRSGQAATYAPLLPFFYTRPVYTIGVEFRATPDNVALRRAALVNRTASAQSLADQEAEIAVMEKNLGRYAPVRPSPFAITRLETGNVLPRRIAVLVDGAGGAAEQLLLAMRQSTKVTLMGHRNSAGLVDYADPVSTTTPSGRFVVQWPTSRSLRLPGDAVDPDGIAPDIRVPANVKDPVSFARDWLERQPP